MVLLRGCGVLQVHIASLCVTKSGIGLYRPSQQQKGVREAADMTVSGSASMLDP